MKGDKTIHLLLAIYKNQLKRIKDLNVGLETMKPLEDNKGKKHFKTMIQTNNFCT